ncbi:MerC domain-containing protein [Parahaliea mediterranea]|uniref:MerC domain-containing protein n=1 Tax=Parahaliea mediterranea TaxID=651086 RepID=UPI000E2FE1F2|nr:MerC domain-containing protein [Parahaliea mediterranea]
MNIDRAAIGLSLACAIHCLLLPLAVVMLPALAGTAFGDERFHQWMLLVVIPTSAFALTMGCRRHRNFGVLIPALAGLALLTLAVLFGHDLLGDDGEKIASLTGALLIAISHLRNHTLCRRSQCDDCDTRNE